MRKIFRPLLLAALLGSVCHPVFADDSREHAAFEKAYKKYQHLVQIGHAGEALGAAKDAYEHGRKVFGPDSKNTAALAINYGQLADGEAARAALKDAVRIYEKLYGPDAKELVDPLIDLAGATMKYGDSHAGYSYYRQALDIADKTMGKGSLSSGMILLEMGRSALSRAQSRDALGYLRRAQKTFEKLDGEQAKLQLAATNFWLGKYFLAIHSRRTATDELLNALKTFEKVAPRSRITMSTHAFLIKAYEERGMHDEATVHCKAISAAKPFDPNQDYLPVYYVQPTYPRAMQIANREGSVVVSVTVDPDGFVKDPKVISRKGPDAFDDAAIEAVKKFRYVPRFKDGQTVATRDVKYRFSFKLER